MARLRCSGCGRSVASPSPNTAYVCRNCGESMRSEQGVSIVGRVILAAALLALAVHMYVTVDWERLLGGY